VTILSTIMGVESGGGRNLTQGNIGDINNATGDLAQGYYQITGGTWQQFGGAATGYNSALAAPYGTQLQVASNIPVNRWGPNTQAQLRANGYQPMPGETLGQMLNRYGEDPSATRPADGASVGAGVIAQGDPNNSSSGIAAGSGAGSTGGTPGQVGMAGAVQKAIGAVTGAIGGQQGQGQQIQVGLQQSLFGDINKWIAGISEGVWKGLWKSVSASFLSIQNWFIRAFLIIVGLVILAIGLMKITGTDKVVIQAAKDVAMAAA
jgi:hypothetical protein